MRNKISKTIKNVPVLFLTLLLALSIISFDRSLSLKNEYNVRIVIRNPTADCAQSISFNSYGKGQSIRGLSDDYILDSFTTFKRVIHLDSFNIDKGVDLKKISLCVEKINNNSLIGNAQQRDARRVQLFINDTLKIDTFNEWSNESKAILQLISPYLKYNVYSQCGEQ